jgi:hypothetical protein
MTMAITSWLRGYFATRERTAELRGLAEINAGTSERRAWPRTTGADVIMIAAIVDPALRAYPLRWGGHGIGRRWRVCVDDLERFALPAPRDEYPPNPSFWSAIAAACVYLHASQAPLPEQPIWSALLDRLGTQSHGGTMIDSWTQAYIELRRCAEVARGVSDGDSLEWPRTTGADVLALGAPFHGFVHGVEPDAPGGVAVARRWRQAMLAVERAAIVAPEEIFAGNRTFWSALAQLCAFLDSVYAAPPDRAMWNALLDRFREACRAAG